MKLDFLFILLALLLGSVGSIALAALIMLLKDEVLEKVSMYLTYLAGGTLLGAAFLGLIPEALTLQTAAHVLPMILIGILFFFLLEKMILWHTCRNKNCERQLHAASPMM
jgi:zinc and cadmium transporter